MVLQKLYLGKLLNKIFDPFLGLKSQKITIFARFLSFSRILGPKNHENPYFYKISKITFFLTTYEDDIYGFAAYLDQN